MEPTLSVGTKRLRVYPDTSFLSSLVKPHEKQSLRVQEVWKEFLAGRFEMLYPVLVENELDARCRQFLHRKRGFDQLMRVPALNRWPPIICGMSNPITGRLLVAGERRLETRRPYRAGDSFENPAIKALCKAFVILKRDADSNRHVSDEEDIRHLIQAAEWQCNVFLTCEEKGKIWKRRDEIHGIIEELYSMSLEILQPEGMLGSLGIKVVDR